MKEKGSEILKNNGSTAQVYSFTYLTTSMTYAKEEKEEPRIEELGNTLINQVL